MLKTPGPRQDRPTRHRKPLKRPTRWEDTRDPHGTLHTTPPATDRREAKRTPPASAKKQKSQAQAKKEPIGITDRSFYLILLPPHLTSKALLSPSLVDLGTLSSAPTTFSPSDCSDWFRKEPVGTATGQLLHRFEPGSDGSYNHQTPSWTNAIEQPKTATLSVEILNDFLPIQIGTPHLAQRASRAGRHAQPKRMGNSVSAEDQPRPPPKEPPLRRGTRPKAPKKPAPSGRQPKRSPRVTAPPWSNQERAEDKAQTNSVATEEDGGKEIKRKRSRGSYRMPPRTVRNDRTSNRRNNETQRTQKQLRRPLNAQNKSS